MKDRSHPDRRPRRRVPDLEAMEARELPTAPTLLAGLSPAVAIRSAVADTPREPTPREQARQRFFAAFSGTSVTGPGRFTDQASQTYIQGGGNSSAFLHGNLQMVLYTPVDRGDAVAGNAALIVKNVTNSGNLLLLDLEGDTQSLDRAGRPTRLSWTVNGGSGGTFSGATGEGTVEIRYPSGGKRGTPARGAGAIFTGSIETIPVNNIARPQQT